MPAPPASCAKRPGAGEESFTGDQVASTLEDEIRLLRERGFTDERIAELCSGLTSC